jgi:NADPH:quinone reductase-like Zn-dependent oxidoreductase
LHTGQRVLGTAAAGGVGTVAVQLAKWKETHVIGTASEHSISLLQELGVDEIIDYKKTKVQDTIKEPLDLIFNLAPLPENEVTDLLQLLKKGGTLVTAVMPARESIAQELGVTAIRMASQRNAQQLTHIATLVNLGIIKPRITERLPLENIRDVHERTEIKNGKTLIVVNDTIN